MFLLLLSSVDEQKNELLRLAATAEQDSEHPIAKAILRAAKEKGEIVTIVTMIITTTGITIPSLPDKAINNFVGNGIRCNCSDGNNIFVGNRSFM